MNTSIEQLSRKLSSLYRSYGYISYSMSKFEEYELYLRNKDFLISDRVLTFTDTDGKLMALKPDVTLSIIKNTRDSAGVQKLYYRENVYRPGSADQGFREIMQVGLECMGNIGSYNILEVILLAVKSLQTVSENCMLDISHMGLLSGLLKKSGVTEQLRSQVLAAIGSKNAHEIQALCESCGADSAALVRLAKLSGKCCVVMPQLEQIFADAPEFAQFKQLIDALEQAKADAFINIDFSVVNDMRYYNGIAFRGFVEGVPDGVLAGGQYDALMQKMNRKAKAIGFALYPDLLERIALQQEETGADTALLYNSDTALSDIAKAVEELTQQGMAVNALPADCDSRNYRKIYKLAGKKVQELG
ncbi:MAG: ATP phosphoribosyltransferase regulatory subunit [Oscillospiraceae bacterium]|nr:ATP phosphoribosyltransferase regulatory subunit [Oscillospiraceae bacterium]